MIFKYVIFSFFISTFFIENSIAASIINRRTGEEIRITCDSYSCDNLIFNGPGIGKVVLTNSEYLTLLKRGILNTYNTRKDLHTFPISRKMYETFGPRVYMIPFTPISILLNISDLLFVAPIQLIRKNAKKRQAIRTVRKLRKAISKDKTLKLSNRRFEMIIDIINAGALISRKIF